MTTPDEIRQEVQKNYAEVARSRGSCCSPSNTLYPLEAIQDLPASRIVAMSFCEPRSCRLQLSS